MAINKFTFAEIGEPPGNLTQPGRQRPISAYLSGHPTLEPYPPTIGIKFTIKLGAVPLDARLRLDNNR
jgi:hypothetical protein